MATKVLLIMVGIIIAVMGILTLIPAVELGLWLSIPLIVIGIVCIISGFMAKKEKKK